MLNYFFNITAQYDLQGELFLSSKLICHLKVGVKVYSDIIDQNKWTHPKYTIQ